MRPLRTGGAILAAATIVIAGLSAPAAARPLPGVQGLTAAVTKPGTAYHLAVDWADLAGATSYRVALKDAAGVVLVSDNVASSAWAVNTTKPAMSVVKVTVTGLSATRKGKPVTISRTLPDLTAPTASYSVSQPDDTATVTVTESGLSDDVTPAGGIAREVNWGEPGGTFGAWDAGTSLQHSYPLAEARYVPQVRLTDQAGNARLLDLRAVVVGDEVAPTGTFGLVRTTKVWAKFTPVTVTQSALSDNWTPANKIIRSMNWGDGNVQTWTVGTSLRHVYAVGGTFTPKLTLTDEASNATVVTFTAVTVTADKVAPKVSLIVPKVGLRMVRSWQVVRGKAVDAGVGMGTARVRVIEKRGTAWYSYLPAKKAWTKAGTRVRAMKLAGLATLKPGLTGVWSLRLKGLKRGTLVIQYSGVDRAGNVAKPLVRKQLLTRW